MANTKEKTGLVYAVGAGVLALLLWLFGLVPPFDVLTDAGGDGQSNRSRDSDRRNQRDQNNNRNQNKNPDPSNQGTGNTPGIPSNDPTDEFPASPTPGNPANEEQPANNTPAPDAPGVPWRPSPGSDNTATGDGPVNPGSNYAWTGDNPGDGNPDPSLRTGEDGNVVYDPAGNNDQSVGIPNAPPPGGRDTPSSIPTDVDLNVPVDRLSAALAAVGWATKTAGEAAYNYARDHPDQAVLVAATVGSGAVGGASYILYTRVGATAISEAAASRLLSAGVVSAGSLSEARQKIQNAGDGGNSHADEQVTVTNPDHEPVDAPDTLPSNDNTTDDTNQPDTTQTPPSDDTIDDRTTYHPSPDTGGHQPAPDPTNDPVTEPPDASNDPANQGDSGSENDPNTENRWRGPAGGGI